MAFANDTRGKLDDAQAQIARLREQVEAMMKDRVTPGRGGFRRPGGKRRPYRKRCCARSGPGGIRPGKGAATDRDHDRRCGWAGLSVA